MAASHCLSVEKAETVSSITTDQTVQARMQSTIKVISLDQRDGKTQDPSKPAAVAAMGMRSPLHLES